MKRIIAIAALLFAFSSFSPTLHAQSESLRKFAKKYKNGSEVKKIKVGGWLVRLGADFSNEPEIETLRPLFKTLDLVQVLVFDENTKPEEADIKKLVKGLRSEQFEDLMTVRDGKDRVNLMVRTNKSGSKIYEMVFIASEGDKGDAVVLGIEGEFKMSDVQKMLEKGELSFNK